MPFITGYISNWCNNWSKILSCKGFNALYHGLHFKRNCNFRLWLRGRNVSMPFITGYISNFIRKELRYLIAGFNALYHGLHFKPWLWECPYLLGLKVTLRGNLNFFLLTYHFTFEMCHKPSKYKYRGKFCIC